MTQLETKLYEALKGFMDIKHRMSRCPDPTCFVCKENAKVIKQAREAVSEYESVAMPDDIPF